MMVPASYTIYKLMNETKQPTYKRYIEWIMDDSNNGLHETLYIVAVLIILCFIIDTTILLPL